MAGIQSLVPRKRYDARGNSTLEVDRIPDDGTVGRGSVTAGASTGIHEAKKLEDIDQAVRNVSAIGNLFLGQDPAHQEKIDLMLLETDGTPEKSNLGANVTLAISLAACDAAARS